MYINKSFYPNVSYTYGINKATEQKPDSTRLIVDECTPCECGHVDRKCRPSADPWAARGEQHASAIKAVSLLFPIISGRYLFFTCRKASVGLTPLDANQLQWQSQTPATSSGHPVCVLEVRTSNRQIMSIF
jgi:hypothetical protein